TGEWLDFVKPDANGASTPVRAGVIRVGPGLRLLVGRDIRELAQIRQLFTRAAAQVPGDDLASRPVEIREPAPRAEGHQDAAGDRERHREREACATSATASRTTCAGRSRG